MQKWVPKHHVLAVVSSEKPITPSQGGIKPVITPVASTEVVSSAHEGGWLASTKIARRSANRSILFSGPSRGFELLVREQGEDLDEVEGLRGVDVII